MANEYGTITKHSGGSAIHLCDVNPLLGLETEQRVRAQSLCSICGNTMIGCSGINNEGIIYHAVLEGGKCEEVGIVEQ